MIRKIIISLVVATTIYMSQAQSLEQFKERLSEPSSMGASVVIDEEPEAKRALEQIIKSSTKSEFLGYRIGIFFDNSPVARAKAYAAKSLFVEKFPYESVYMIYENPYFKVSAGNCVTQEEAVILLDKIQRHFPKAYIMREQLEVKDIVTSQRVMPIQSDSLRVE